MATRSTIGGLYRRIDRALKGELPGEVWVQGEVRSFNVSSRGHCYIELVDPASAHDAGSPVLRVVCWSSRWGRVRSTLDQLGMAFDAGLVVRVRGEVRLYKQRGDISFIVTELDTDALLGKVAAERARLVRELVAAGLFDRNRSLPVPPLPLRIGLVASPGTEGYRDFLGQLAASRLAFDVQVATTQVQGRKAAASVAAALRLLQGRSCDLLVIVRGGGSKADLAIFDAEPVAWAVASSALPVWTGIGHTGDQSVVDEVANRSFVTPTDCGHELARIAVEFWNSSIASATTISRLARESVERADRKLERHRHGLVTSTRAHLGRHREGLGHRTSVLRGMGRTQVDRSRHALASSGAALARAAVRSAEVAGRSLSWQAERAAALPDRQLESESRRLAHWRRLLGAYDYQRQLERGYTVTRSLTGQVVRSAAELDVGEAVSTLFVDGEVASEVIEARRAVHGSARRHDEGM